MIAEDLNTLSSDTEQASVEETEKSPTKGMKIQWNVIGSSYFIAPVTNQIPVLPVAVYVIKASMSGLYLERLKDKFEFPFKLYGLETDFIDRVVKTYRNTNSNLGVLLNGTKGTGKTISAEIISNKLHIPIVLINANFEGLVDFLNSIQQDVVLFFDEYEKVFGKGRDSKLLTIMDGALKNNHRKVFILTTNELSVEDNLIQRPSRIRYLKRFGNLPIETIIEIVDDRLKHKERRKDLIHFLSRLEMITVDIINNVIDEVNIHDEDTEKFSPVFNVKTLTEKLDVYELISEEGKPTREQFVRGKLEMSQYYPLTEDHVGQHIKFTSDHQGYIRHVRENGFVIVLERTLTIVKNGADGEEDKVQHRKVLTAYRLSKAWAYNGTMDGLDY